MINAHLAVPSGWTDKSMLAYALAQAPDSGVAPNIVVTCDRFTPELHTAPDRILRFADEQVEQMQAKLANMSLQHRTTGLLAGCPAVRVQISWRAQHVQVTQIVTFVDTGSEDVLIATGTCASADYPRYGAELLQIIETLQPRI